MASCRHANAPVERTRKADIVPGMSSRPTPQTSYQRLAAELRRLIVTGEFVRGERLPSEVALTAQFNVSRSTLREAMRALASHGLIVTTRGVTGGTFVAEPAPDDVSAYLTTSIQLLSRSRISVDQLLEARTALEVPAAELAAQRRTDEHMTALEDMLNDAEWNRRSDHWPATSGFHTVLLEATGNPLLSMLTTPVFQVIRTRFLRERAGPQFWERVNAEHHEIAHRVRESNPEGAAEAMRSHLANLHDTYRRIDVGTHADAPIDD